MSPEEANLESLIADIAKSKLLIDTLEERKSDSLDFHSVAVWTVRDALLAAVELGRRLERERPHQVHQD